MESTLIAHCGTQKLSYDELTLVPTPIGTDTHKPIPHHEVVNALVETLGFRHIGVHKMEFACSPDGMRMFGVLELETMQYGVRFALGLRNSHNKTFALGITVGYRVLVCDNLAFHGDYTPVLRKHSKHFRLIEALEVGVGLTQRNFTPMVQAIESWRATQITDVSAKLLLYEAFVEGGTDLPRHLLRPIHDAYFNPTHEDFQPRTLWSLQNAMTGVIKQLDPIPGYRATASVGRFFENRTH
jgi:hypothetical protein